MAEKMIKVPGIGPVKSTYVYAGVGVGAGIVVYAYWRSSRGGAVADEEVPVEEAPVGEVPAEPDYSYALGAGSYDYGGGTAYPSYLYPNVSGIVSPTMPTTNAEWAQKAREQLENEGVDSGQASSAIGNYLARLCVSAAQADLIRRANAMLGGPPQGTFSVITCPGTPAPGGGTTAPPAGSTLKAPTGLHVLRTYRTEIQVAWNAVATADGYAVFRSDPAGATSTWQRQTTSVFNSYQFKGLKPNTTYRFKIQTIGQDKKPGGSATMTAKTAK